MLYFWLTLLTSVPKLVLIRCIGNLQITSMYCRFLLDIHLFTSQAISRLYLNSVTG